MTVTCGHKYDVKKVMLKKAFISYLFQMCGWL